MLGILVAAAVGIAFSLVLAPMLVEYFRARGVGVLANPDRPATHLEKVGTPDMGGVVFVVAATIAYLLAHVRPTRNGIELQTMWSPGVLVIASLWGQGVVGAVDDVLKISRRNPKGLARKWKMAGTLVVATGLCAAAVWWSGLPPAVSGLGTVVGPSLPFAVFALWVVVFVAGTSHAVNLSDGADGLAGGMAAMIVAVLTLAAFWQFRNPDVYGVLAGSPAAALDVAVAGAAILGSVIGFLWWNAPPARVIMGDTGSLGLGGAIAAMAMFTKTQLLLPVLAGVLVASTVATIIQIEAINRFGRRVFRRAPLQHHFEEMGWHEVTVVTRFWIMSAACAGLSLALFYSEYVRRTG